MRPAAALVIVLVVISQAIPAQGQTAATAAAISGRVIDQTTGTPLADVRVFLYRQPNTGLQAVALTDDAGGYTFTGIPPGDYLLGMNKQGYFGTRRRVIKAVPGARLSSIDLSMAKGGEIVGRVLDPAGSPKAGVSVAAIQIEETGRLMPGVDTAHTSADGSFRVQSLPPGSYVLIANSVTSFAATNTATKVDSVSYFPNEVDVTRAERIDVALSARVTVADFTLRQTRAVMISGVAVDRFGNAVGGREVSAQADWILFGGQKAATRTAADGTFTLGPVAPSVYRLLLEREPITTVTADQDLNGVVLRRAR